MSVGERADADQASGFRADALRSARDPWRSPGRLAVSDWGDAGQSPINSSYWALIRCSVSMYSSTMFSTISPAGCTFVMRLTI